MMGGSRRTKILPGSRPAARTENPIVRHSTSVSHVVSLSPTCLLARHSPSAWRGARRSPSAGKTPAPAEPPLAVIDAHIHTNFDNLFYEVGKVIHSKAELATEMKKYNVVGAVSMNHPGDPYEDLSDLNVVQCVGLAGKGGRRKARVRPRVGPFSVHQDLPRVRAPVRLRPELRAGVPARREVQGAGRLPHGGHRLAQGQAQVRRPAHDRRGGCGPPEGHVRARPRRQPVDRVGGRGGVQEPQRSDRRLGIPHRQTCRTTRQRRSRPTW